MQSPFNIPLGKQKGILFLLIALLSSALAGTVYVFQLPVATSSLEVLSNYTHRGGYTYDLYLHPNLLFPDAVIHGDSGGHYFKNITDRIDIMFTYQFLCEPSATVTGTLATNVTVFAVTSREGDVLWHKDLVTLPPSLNPVQGSEIAIEIPFDLDALYTLIDQIEQEIRVYASAYQVIVSTSLHTVAETGVGVIDEIFPATMTIHLSDNVITINPGLIQEQSGTIEQMSTLSFPWVNNWRVGAIIVLAVLTILTGYYVPIYRQTVLHRSPENLVKKILKKYKDLIISTTQTASMPDASEKTLISVESIDDLHKISEQTSKPIFYTKNPTQPLAITTTHVFFIHDVDMIYALRIDEETPDHHTGSPDITAPASSRLIGGTVPNRQRFRSRIQPLVMITGILMVAAVVWLTVYEGVILSRDVTSIFLGPRSIFFDLGIGLRIIHYLGFGVGCCFVGSWMVLKQHGLIRRLVAARTGNG